MADWYQIKIAFDEPLPKETLDRLAEALVEFDYDFPVPALHSGEFVPYRSPMGGGAELVKILREHGASGIFWLVMDFRDRWSFVPECTDECAVVFREGVDPDILANASRHRNKLARIDMIAEKYVQVAQAFGVSPVPVKWDAVPLLGWVLTDEHGLVEAAVQKLVATE